MIFSEAVYDLARQIPEGHVSTYGEFAKAMGDVRAARAVGAALNLNPDLDGTPCHRVVMSDGTVGGYVDGTERKAEILKNEGLRLYGTKLADFDDVVVRSQSLDSKFSFEDFKARQLEMVNNVSLEDGFDGPRLVTAIDVSCGNVRADVGYGAAVTFDYETKKLVDETTCEVKLDFPYVPSYLAFRELPVIKELYGLLEKKPDILLLDGNGVLHPDKFGVACHAGVELGVPTIGVAKSKLCGKEQGTGFIRHIYCDEDLRGFSLFSAMSASKPIYISPGHKVSYDSAIKVVSRFCMGRRLPEPLRLAHKKANDARLAAKG